MNTPSIKLALAKNWLSSVGRKLCQQLQQLAWSRILKLKVKAQTKCGFKSLEA
jgi:hypothetical protein